MIVVPTIDPTMAYFSIAIANAMSDMRSARQRVDTRHVAAFKTYYCQRVIEEVSRVQLGELLLIAEKLYRFIATGRGTIYIFGNGGSSAIAQHLALALRGRFKRRVHDIRVTCGQDVHTYQAYAAATGYASIFVELLREDRAADCDVVILISGSGNSTNLLEAATYCRAKRIPTISFAGFGGGELSRLALVDAPLNVSVHDQQLAEDVIQPLTQIIAEFALLQCEQRLCECEQTWIHAIGARAAGFNRISSEFVVSLALDVSQAFFDARGVYVLGPEGGGISIVAEHVAHNFNWDAVFKIAAPPQRRVYSTQTQCDFTGISNDRLPSGIAVMQQLEKVNKGDVVVVYAHDASHTVAMNTIRKAVKMGARVYLVAGDHAKAGEAPTALLSLGLCAVEVSADVMQVLGHIAGRVLRLALKVMLNEDIGDNATAFLIHEDMAQRRLIGE